MFSQYYSSFVKFLRALIFCSWGYFLEVVSLSQESCQFTLVRFIHVSWRNLFGGLYSASLASCGEGSSFPYVRKADPWLLILREGRAPLCFSRMFSTYWPRDRSLHDPYRLNMPFYPRDAILNVCCFPCKARLLPDEVCGLLCEACLAHFSCDFTSCFSSRRSPRCLVMVSLSSSFL